MKKTTKLYYVGEYKEEEDEYEQKRSSGFECFKRT